MDRCSLTARCSDVSLEAKVPVRLRAGQAHGFLSDFGAQPWEQAGGDTLGSISLRAGSSVGNWAVLKGTGGASPKVAIGWQFVPFLLEDSGAPCVQTLLLFTHTLC